MHALKKNALRVTAAAGAAALALAASAPAFAQDPGEEETTPAPVEGLEENLENNEEPDETTEGDDEDGLGEDNDGEDGTEDDEDGKEEDDDLLPELPEEFEDDEHYTYAYVDDFLADANPGDLITGAPQFRIDGAPLIEDPAATLLVFTDSTSLESVFSGGDWELTYNAYAVAEYDNCTTEYWGVICVLTDFAPEPGVTYTPSASTPVAWEIVEAVTEDDAAVYWASDIDDETLQILEADGYNLGGSNNFSLVKTDELDEEYWNDFGLLYFIGGLADDDEKMVVTGSSTITLIAAAGAAAVVGAGALFLVRRRKAVQAW
jgi:LPXTG-motif cell wall-anchored protein